MPWKPYTGFEKQILAILKHTPAFWANDLLPAQPTPADRVQLIAAVRSLVKERRIEVVRDFTDAELDAGLTFTIFRPGDRAAALTVRRLK